MASNTAMTSALGELLRRAAWLVRVAERPLGHGAREIYLDEAFEFFRVEHQREVYRGVR